MNKIFSKILIIRFFFSNNNIIVNIDRLKCFRKKVITSGNFNFKKMNRSSYFANKILVENVISYIIQSNKHIVLICSGVSKFKTYLIKKFINSKINILRIIDNTKIPHNGCRSNKKFK